MLRPPSLKEIPFFPITVSVSVAAIVSTLMWHPGQNLNWMLTDARIWSKLELWRALTSTLLHVDFFHLAFNLYWFWTFGALLEREYGHFRFAAIIVMLGFGSALAEFVFLYGGVGLSGVVYGLWGLLWVLQKHDPRFYDAVDERTSRLFIGWFFFCILLTVANVMAVANIAHGVGAGLGVLLGQAIVGRGAVRLQSWICLVLTLALITLGATMFWPSVNLSSYCEPEVERAALEAADDHQLPRAIHLLETATRMNHAPARAWYNLGVVYQQAGRTRDALAAYEHAAQMPDSDSGMQQAATDLKRLVDMVGTNNIK